MPLTLADCGRGRRAQEPDSKLAGSSPAAASSSWLNLAGRWFAGLTDRKLRRSAHRSVTELQVGRHPPVDQQPQAIRLDQACRRHPGDHR